MRWRQEESAASIVELFEVNATGAAVSWTDDRSRDVAIEILVELARRLEEQDCIHRLQLVGQIGSPVDVQDVAAFVRAAPNLLTQVHQAYRFELRLNDGARSYSVGHLDQGASGIWFDTPAGPEPLWAALVAVLHDFAAREDGVRIATGAWNLGSAAEEQ